MKTTGPTSQNRAKSRPRVHKRTILFVTLVVILPWILFSIPADGIGGAGTTGLNVNHSQHGWPFIQMRSTHYDLYGSWTGRTFVPGKPNNIDTKPRAIESFNRFFDSPERDSKFLEFDPRLTKSQYGEFGYWRGILFWHLWDDEHHFEIRWLGLLANLLLGSMVAVLVGWRIEKRIRSGNLFKFSLFSVGVLVTLLCIGLTFAVNTYRSFLTEQSYIENLEQLAFEDLLNFYVEYTDRFPRVISQLINGGYEPWYDQQISRMISDGHIDVDLDDYNDEQMASLLSALDQGDFDLSVALYEHNERTEKYLKQLDAHRIVSLDINYDADLWLYERMGEVFFDMPFWEAMQKETIAVDLDLKLPHIEDVSITLDRHFTAEEQLETFLDLPPETKVFIEWMGDDAASFLLETEEQWPDPPYLDWSENEMSSELHQKMLQRFPHPEEDEDGFGKGGGVF